MTFLLPIFLVFCATHLVLILTAILGRVRELPPFSTRRGGLPQGGRGPRLRCRCSSSSCPGVLDGRRHLHGDRGRLQRRAESSSEPRVHDAKRTMLYMALSLAFTAGGILFAYLLVHAHPTAGKTMNGGARRDRLLLMADGRPPDRIVARDRDAPLRRDCSSSSPPRRGSSTARACSRTWPMDSWAPHRLRPALRPPRHEERRSPDRARVGGRHALRAGRPRPPRDDVTRSTCS